MQPMKHRRSLLAIAAAVAMAVSCTPVPPATAQERSARDQWAARVSPQARQEVMAEADRHTNWGEKRKIQYEIDRFQKIYHQEQLKVRKHAPSTTSPTTAATTTTRATTTGPSAVR
jgi:hypothetical protein